MSIQVEGIMKTQTGNDALAAVRLRQISKDVHDAKTAGRVALRKAASAERKQLASAHRALAKAMRAQVSEQIKAMKADLKEQIAEIGVELKASIEESNKVIAKQFRDDIEAAAAAGTLAGSIAARDVGRGDTPVVESAVTMTDALVAFAEAA